IGLAAILAVVVGVLFGLHIINSQPQVHYIDVNAPYVFLKPEGNGQYDLGYYGPHGNWHDLGIYNVSSNALENAVNIINQFNQQNMGTTLPQPYGVQFQPLDYVVAIGNTTGTVQIPVHGNTILLDKTNPGLWTVLVTDPKDVNALMYALDTGYKESAHLNPLSQYWTSQYPGSVIYEIGELDKYSSGQFGGSNVIVTNNNTLIPWGYLAHTPQFAQGSGLPFVQQASANRYS
ncbi:MAG: hypothetical protein ACP5HQ_09050, partial [Thermoprotei archaeon]